MCNKAFSDLSNLQKHRKTHKNVQDNGNQLGESMAANEEDEDQEAEAEEEDEAAAALSSLTAEGQHIIYVTTENGEQSQLLISTLGGGGVGEHAEEEPIQMVDDDGQEESCTLVAEEEEPSDVNADKTLAGVSIAAGDDDMLTIVGDANNEIGQAVEFTTQDGRRVCLIIPPNVDPFEFTTEYLSNLS